MASRSLTDEYLPIERDTGASGDDEDLGDPGEADDAAHRASYLYEHVIDALVVFSARYIRTAALLTRRPSIAADRLLTDLDAPRGRFTRPMAFLAVSYLLFVALYANLPWMADLIESGAVGMRPDQATTQRFTLPLVELLGGFGDVEKNYLVIAILAPLPAVVLVSLMSTMVANVFGQGGDHPRARFASLIQYSVGLGMLGLTWLMAQTVLLTGALVKLIEAANVRGDEGGLAVTAIVFLVWGLVMTVATGVLILGITILPVWRTLKMLPDMRRMGVIRRSLMSLSGPSVLLITLVGMQALIALTEMLEAAPVGLHLARKVVGPERVVLEAAVRNQKEGPVAITGWRALWRSDEDHATACRDVSADGNSAVVRDANVPTPHLLPVVPEALTDDLPQLAEHVLYLQPGESVWLRLEARRPAGRDAHAVSSMPLLCVRTSADASRWIALGE